MTPLPDSLMKEIRKGRPFVEGEAMRKQSAAQRAAEMLDELWSNSDDNIPYKDIILMMADLKREDRQRRQMMKAVLERGLYLAYAAKALREADGLLREVHEAITKFRALHLEPEPGLHTWHEAVDRAKRNIDDVSYRIQHHLDSRTGKEHG